MNWLLDKLTRVMIVQNATRDKTLEFVRDQGAGDIDLGITCIYIMIKTTRDQFLQEWRKRIPGIEFWAIAIAREQKKVMFLTTVEGSQRHGEDSEKYML